MTAIVAADVLRTDDGTITDVLGIELLSLQTKVLLESFFISLHRLKTRKYLSAKVFLKLVKISCISAHIR